MANTQSALKRIRQSAANRNRNRSQRSRMRSAVKELRAKLEAGDAAGAREALPETLRLIDVTAQKGAVHKNQAARTKSRLTQAVEKAAAQTSG